MSINPQNYGGSADAENLSDPTLGSQPMSTSTPAGGYTTAGADYVAGTGYELDADSGETGISSKVNVEAVTRFYDTAVSWISKNPAAAVSAAAGVVAIVSGIIAYRQSYGSAGSGYLNKYPNGKTYGNSYSSGSVSYNPATHTETINPVGNYDNSASGYDSGL